MQFEAPGEEVDDGFYNWTDVVSLAEVLVFFSITSFVHNSIDYMLPITFAFSIAIITYYLL